MSAEIEGEKLEGNVLQLWEKRISEGRRSQHKGGGSSESKNVNSRGRPRGQEVCREVKSCKLERTGGKRLG